MKYLYDLLPARASRFVSKINYREIKEKIHSNFCRNAFCKPSVICCSFIFFSVSTSLAQLNVDFKSDIQSGCVPIIVNFFDESQQGIDEWRWDLGNGTFSNLKNPSGAYFTPGKYSIKLIVKKKDQVDSIVKTEYITVYQPPVAQFSSNINEGCIPFTIDFYDRSTYPDGAVNTLLWDFGDGSISNDTHPKYQYQLVGKHNVTLKITDSNGCTASLRKDDYITTRKVTAAFSFNVAGTCDPTRIIFQNLASGTDTVYNEWDFGDGTFSSIVNPAHVYARGGKYVVKLVARNKFGCEDTSIKTISVLDPVSAFFTADNLINCKIPVSVTFTAAKLPGNSYYWNFGDTSYYAGASVSHIYTSNGNKTIKLIVKNNNGCKDSSQRIDYIKNHLSSLKLDNLPDSGCRGLTKTFSVSGRSVANITGFIWDFGDGSRSMVASPAHQFQNSGYYDVTLYSKAADGCTDTTTIPYAIKTSDRPVAGFSAAPLTGCAKNPVKFTNLTTGNATSWAWDFGDKLSSGEKQPTHIFIDTGQLTVTLIATNGGCSDTAVNKNYIYTKPSVSKFSYTFDCRKPFEAAFKNMSIGSNRCLWDFGDGTKSTVPSPTHTFRGEGIYSVSLQTWNDKTGCDYTLTKKVRILRTKAAFNVTDSVICRKDTAFFFSPLNPNDIARFTWDFGDGSKINSTSNKISHVYSSSGVFTVKLITLNVMNCFDTLIKYNYIKVNGPVARFSLESQTGCANTSISFIDKSLPGSSTGINKWIWTYGDGSSDTSGSAPFTHSYSNQGSYKPFLKVVDNLGCTDTITMATSLNIIKVSAHFFISDSLICLNTPVKFTAPYWRKGMLYRWSFGDGTNSSEQLPFHKYADTGTFNVKLYMMDLSGCEDSSMVLNALKVVQTEASFSMSDSFKTCPPLLINFSNTSTNAMNEYWDFGDSTFSATHNPSHFYTYPGVYTAVLYTKGPGGCAKKAVKTIEVKGPTGKLSFSKLTLCRPYALDLTVRSNDAASYIWDLNDGHTITTPDSVIHYTYRDSGIFVPRIVLVDDKGCKVPLAAKDTLKNIFVTPSFEFHDTIFCDRANIPFRNTSFSNDVIIATSWNFGDNVLSNQHDPAHLYNKPGVYFPSLKVTTSNGCFRNFTSSTPVKVNAAPTARMLLPQSGCVPLNISLRGEQEEADTSDLDWLWVFGNGNTSALKEPPIQEYGNPGTYKVDLTVTNSAGCKQKLEQYLEAYPLPVIQLPLDTFVCKNQPISLTPKGAAFYKWTPSSWLNCDSCVTVLASPPSDIQYKVEGISLKGCKNDQLLNLHVKQPFNLTVQDAGKICAGEKKKLQAGGAVSYQWSPSYGLSATDIASPVAQPDTTVNYRVIGTGEEGCFKDTGYIRLNVYPVPVVDAGSDKTINVGRSLELMAKFSDDVTEVRWSPTDGIFRNSTDIVTVKPVENTEYTVEVKNRGGCKAADKMKVFVICNGTNVFIPNVFSPNSDGVNDIFYPRGTGIFKIRTMKIFNRWGQLVFERSSFNSNDASAGWDGTYKGTKLNTDVFIYTIELMCDNNSMLALNGNIALVN